MIGGYSAVLDSSAVIALFRSEPGSTNAAAFLASAALSAVNLAEVVSKLPDWNTSEASLNEFLATIKLSILPFDAVLAYETGQLRGATRQYGLSLGDRACLATAKALGVPAVTTDRNWQKLNLGIDIRMIR